MTSPIAQPAWSERLSDRINPILVREILQAMTGRIFMVTLALAVAAVSMIGLGVVAFDVDDGHSVITAALVMLAPIALFVIPLQSFMSMRHEVVGGTAEQLLMTRLRPRRIVIGKLLASMAMFVLFLGMFAPLLGLTYLLRGIDVPTIAIILGFTMLASLLANAFAISMAALGRVRVLGPGCGILAILVLCGAAFGTMVGSWGIIWGIQNSISEPEFVNAIVAICLGFAALTWLFGAIAASVLGHEHENRSTPFRVFCFAVPVLAFSWVAWSLEPRHLDDGAPIVAMVMACVCAPVMLTLASEQRELSPRVARFVPKRPKLAALISPFLPGGGRAMTLCLIVGSMSLLAGVLIPFAFGVSPRLREVWFAVGAWEYLFIYVAIARFVRRGSVPLPSGFWSAIITVALTIVAGVLFSIVTFALGHPTGRWSVLQIGNVFWTLERLEGGREQWVVGLLGLICALFLALIAADLFSSFREVREASRKRRAIEA